jgi:hypothetical protein
MAAPCFSSKLDWSKLLPARESFLVRTDPKVLEAMRRWAADELRSVNGQVDYLLRRALAEAGRLPPSVLTPDRTAEGGGAGNVPDGGDIL